MFWETPAESARTNNCLARPREATGVWLQIAHRRRDGGRVSGLGADRTRIVGINERPRPNLNSRPDCIIRSGNFAMKLKTEMHGFLNVLGAGVLSGRSIIGAKPN